MEELFSWIFFNLKKFIMIVEALMMPPLEKMENV